MGLGETGQAGADRHFCAQVITPIIYSPLPNCLTFPQVGVGQTPPPYVDCYLLLI